MKTNKFFIVTLLVATAVSVAVVSCKKETLNALSSNTSQSVKTFAAPQVDDMNAYLKNFKQKMQTATRDGNETLSLEEAAWHLSSVANYEFANANVEYNAVRFDTLYAHVNITNGGVLLSDLGVAYEEISTSIEKFFSNLALENKHFRFINAFISENGEVAIPLLVTYNLDSKDITTHCWYYPSEWNLIYACDTIFPIDTYFIQTEGTPALQYALHMIVSNPISNNISIPGPPGTIYYTYASSKQFTYDRYIDPYGSSFYDSRLFLSYGTTNAELSSYDICYLYDSYLGLGFDNCPTNQVIGSWNVQYGQNGTHTKEFHTLTVTYATEHTIGPIPGQGGN